VRKPSEAIRSIEALDSNVIVITAVKATAVKIIPMSMSLSITGVYTRSGGDMQ
jgi:hypothetical protein